MITALRNVIRVSASSLRSMRSQFEFSKKMSTDSDFVTISYVTTPNETVAGDLSKPPVTTRASKLIRQRLAACVNIVKNVESIYEWKGNIEHDSELLLIIKSNSSKAAALTKFVEDNHPYDCPEVVTMKVDSGSAAYLNWVHSAVKLDPLSSSGSDKSKD